MAGQALSQDLDLFGERSDEQIEPPANARERLLSQLESELAARGPQSTIRTLNALMARYEKTIDSISQGVCIFDAAQKLVLCNRRFAEIYRLEPEDVTVGKTLREIVERRYAVGACPGMALEEYLSLSSAVGRGVAPDVWTTALQDGRSIRIHHQPLPDGGWLSTHEDITERKLANVLHEEQAHLLEMIAARAPLEHVLDRLIQLIESQLPNVFGSLLLLDKDGVRLRHGAAPSLPSAYTKAIDGASIGPSVGSCGTAAYRRETVVVADIMSDPLWADFKELAREHGLRSCWSTPVMSHSGEVLGTFAIYSKEVREPTPGDLRLVEVASRIAGIAIERKVAEDRIHFMANHDTLTGLPNRALLKDRLTQALHFAKRYDRWATAAIIDLDNFKFVNDSLGHNAGDELLKIIASRMVNCIRATDTVLRLGGDEFVVLLFDQPKDPDAIIATLQKIRSAIGETIYAGGHDFQLTCSIGLANYPNDGTDADTLLANADSAMYRAKEIGGDNFQFHAPECNIKGHEKFLLQKELRNAIVRSEFSLVYQPQVELQTGRIFAVEALIRWSNPSRGVVPPAKFIPIAEETGLIVAIGEWVLHEACRQNKAWQDAGLPPMAVCVNVSARQFRQRDWVARVAETLRETGLEAKYLELELTESLIMQDVEQAIETMRELQLLGVQLSIDDFGTGYSSLAALKRFPVARLKIDKSFIDDIPTDENDKAVAGAVISLGQKLNLRVIAEGVETDEQVAFLRDNNCDEMQGYRLSKPLPASELETLIERRPRLGGQEPR